ncbi:MAG: helix-turn-helix domain-containing protein [Bacteroidetes bacterium]|nr:MAG: helix-turn-helix domain-containing protein [Bacteroidota bacterium]TAG90247.1 MAG: helix-turn-helix domain-containing protein [Bacteroidota bacterium]
MEYIFENQNLMTTKEAADVLKVSEISIKRYISQGLIPSVKIGGARRIIQNEVWEDFLNHSVENIDDTPDVINGVQFYWSQKSGAVAKQIYQEYCKENDVILDAFLGGGSSLYGIRNGNYKFIGVDINEFSHKIAKFNLQNVDNQFIEHLRNEVIALQKQYNPIYHYQTKDNKILEFIKVVFDDKENPQIKTIYLQDLEGNRFTSENYPETIDFYLNNYQIFKEKIKSLENPLLVKNSRIAIKENMFLADIFSPINFFVLSGLKEKIKDNENLKFILSSILQLCKLTDTKSQSQFPFWLPKTDLVDRNIFITLLNKIHSLKKQIGQGEIKEVENFEKLKYTFGSACLLINKPLQNITNEIVDNSVDFVLTDPPYFDQVAYSEYAKIWEFFCGYKANFEDEIIVSQREINPSNEVLYLENLQKAFQIIFNKMKNNAKMLIYFKDSRPDKMFAFLDILDKIGFSFLGQEYLETSKFTYKQNTTTKTTLTGESILKLQKVEKIIDEDKENLADPQGLNLVEVENLITHFTKTYLFTHKEATLNEILSSGLIKLLYDNKALSLLKKAKDFTDIFEKSCNYNEENRTYALKKTEVKNQLFLGDCLDILKAIPTHSIDCVITDPPYNISGYDHKKQIGWLKSNDFWKKQKAFKKIDEKWDKFSDDDYENFTIAWLTEVKRIVKPNGNIAIFGSYHNIYKIGYLIEKLELKTINSIIWYKRNAFPNVTQRMFCESTEQIIWCVNENKKNAKNWTFNYQTMKEINGGVQMRNMFDVPLTKQSEREFGKHPSQKPLEVLNNLVLALTNEGDVVLDCFLGSGTTVVSALQHKRNFVGVEQSFEYLQIAEKRLENIENTIFDKVENVKNNKKTKVLGIFD